MKLAVISHVIHKYDKGSMYGYAPYIKEMNLWLKYVDEVRITAPLSTKKLEPIDAAYQHDNIQLIDVPGFNICSFRELVKTVFIVPYLFFFVVRTMWWADHIHLRCPGNMGLIGCIAQFIFPKKIKTAKYAGNWDPTSKQPWSYNLQKRLLSNRFFTRNMSVMVYGEWENQSKNIVPFFTASYHEKEKKKIEHRSFDCRIRLIFVGALSTGKRPLLCIQTLALLRSKGMDVQLDLFGEGIMRDELSAYIAKHDLADSVILHGNQSAETIKQYFGQAHFLIFPSQSEGWPKVVAEAMFWGCLPITTDVSCVKMMIGNGTRGKITVPDAHHIAALVYDYLADQNEYHESSERAKAWSRQYTLEKFEAQIKQLLNPRNG